jgi:hypothetical protein
MCERGAAHCILLLSHDGERSGTGRVELTGTLEQRGYAGLDDVDLCVL